MKFFLLISFFTSLSGSAVFGQCPNGGLNLQSDACEAPTNLKIASISCNDINLQWNGKAGQAYQVKVTSYNLHLANMAEVKAVQVHADASGNCRAVVPIKEGSHVSWLVQAVCTSGNSSLYSAEVAGNDTAIPVCPKETVPMSNIIAVYPNPAKNCLTVEYTSNGGGITVFEIFNISGNKVFSKTETAIVNTKVTYSLDISRLPPETYLLKTINEKDGTSQTKFVKILN